MARELTGTVEGPLILDEGETVVHGTVIGPVTVAAAARLVVYGTGYGPIKVHGRLVLKGTLYRKLLVEEGGDCLLEGALYGDVVNRGKLRADVDTLGGSIREEATGERVPHRGDFRRERRPDGTIVHSWES